MTPDTSVILTTYERPRHLALVLAGHLRQTAGDFELIVADDGSGPETAAVIRRFAAEAPFRVRHVHHPRRGHRRTVILNRAIAAAHGEYVVFSDGDCLPPADFVAVHRARRERSRMLVGGFVRISPRDTARADAAWVESGAYEGYGTLRQQADVLRRHLKSELQVWLRQPRRPHNLGLNMSVHRAHLLAVNGYDERYRGWGRADGDLRERLKRVGVRPRSIWNRSVVYHLHHPIEPTRHDVRANRAYRRRPGVAVFARDGIDRDPGASHASVSPPRG